MASNVGKFLVQAAVAACLVPWAAAVAPTDSYRDADIGQTGYLPNHNMDPAVVDSTTFGQLWTKAFNAKEKVETSLAVGTKNSTLTPPFSSMPNH